ncbi:MAG: tetratricopeptide repeat protein [Gemmataceae bacterium]
MSDPREWRPPRLIWILTFLLFAVFGCASDEQQRLAEFNEDGVFLFQRGDYIRARENFEFALTKFKPDDPTLLYNIGQCHDRMGQRKEAEKRYRECLEKDPNHAACRQALSRLLVLEGRPTEARTMIKGWLTSQPKLANAYVEDARYYQQNGDYLKAQTRLQQALALEPNNARALTQLGILYEAKNMPARARVMYERALEADPQRAYLRTRINSLIKKGIKSPMPLR